MFALRRNLELDQLGSLFAECICVGARVIVLEGGSGCGKSKLLEEFLQHAVESGAVVVNAGDPCAEIVSLSTVDLPRNTGDFDEFSVWLQNVSCSTPIVICFDDVNDTHGDYLCNLLEFFRSKLSTAKAMLLLVHGGRSAALGADYYAELSRQPELHRIRLAPPSGTEVARNYGALRRAPADRRTVLRLLRAAEAELEDDATEEAVACLDLARDSCRDPRQRARICLMKALVLWRKDPFLAEVGYLDKRLAELQDAVAVPPEPEAALLAQLLIGHGRYEEARELLASTPSAGSAADPVGRQTPIRRLQVWQFCPAPAVCEELPGWMTDAQLDIAGGPQYTGQDFRGTNQVTPDNDRLGRPEVVRSVERVLRGSRLSDAMLAPILRDLGRLVRCGRTDLAAEWTEHFLAEATRRDLHGWQALFAGARACMAWRQGQLAKAEHMANMVLEMTVDRSGPMLHGGPLAILVSVYTETGRYQEAARLLDAEVPETVFRSVFGLDYLRARGRYLLAVGRPYSALSDFLRIESLIRRWDMPSLNRVTWWIDAAEALICMGETRRAGALLAEHEPRTDPAQGRAVGAALRLRAAMAAPAERLPLLARSADVLWEAEDLLGVARTLTELALACQEASKPRWARATLREAWQAAADCGATVLVEHIESSALWEQIPRIRPSTGHGSGRGRIFTSPVQVRAALSESESRVAVLAARGLTNREISAELFLTVSTVEQHLTQVYRKLRVVGRKELPRALRPEAASA
jgi:DNA-binding CsgD family transcriptional regulator